MSDGSLISVIAGIAAGIALIVSFSMMFKPDFMLTEGQLISKYSKIPEIPYFLEKYPDAIVEVNTNPYERGSSILFQVERQVDPPSYFYAGLHSLGIGVYTNPYKHSLLVYCGQMGDYRRTWTAKLNVNRLITILPMSSPDDARTIFNNHGENPRSMVTYILLVTLTEYGRQNFKTSWTTTRDEFKNQVAKLGGTMTGYVTAGPYDVIEIIDVPNDDGALALLLGSLSVKEIRTVTLRAFHEDQVRKTMQQLS